MGGVRRGRLQSLRHSVRSRRTPAKSAAEKEKARGRLSHDTHGTELAHTRNLSGSLPY